MESVQKIGNLLLIFKAITSLVPQYNMAASDAGRLLSTLLYSGGSVDS